MRLLSLSLAFCLLGASPSWAKDDDAKAQAKAHFEQAETHYRLQEYDQAIVELKEAYRLFPSPLFLYNIGECYRNMKDYSDALTYYENYLDKSPKAKNRTE